MLFMNLGVLDKAKILELDNQQNAIGLQKEMSKFTKLGRTSVPQVFIAGESLGGNDGKKKNFFYSFIIFLHRYTCFA